MATLEPWSDAEAAGFAEVEFGAGKTSQGVVAVITLGTGIGSALKVDGKLVPNTEFGHAEIDGQYAELTTSAVARERNALSWREYARHLSLRSKVVPAQLQNAAGTIGAATHMLEPSW